MKATYILLAMAVTSCTSIDDFFHKMGPTAPSPMKNANLVYRNKKTGAIEMIAQTDNEGNMKVHDFTNARTGEFMAITINNNTIVNRGSYYELHAEDGRKKIISIAEGNRLMRRMK